MKRLSLLVVALLMTSACDCNNDTDLGPDGSMGNDIGVGSDGNTGFDVSADGPFSINEAGQVLCGDGPCACSNGMDDDGDGLVDGADPECTGPYDDDEATFSTGIPGDNRDPNCQDCFFDGNSGSGDDRCRYATSCLIDGTPSSGSGACMTCEVSDECRDNCGPRTPNGCDCFGCCSVTVGADEIFVQIGGSCSVANINDEVICPRCIQTTDCMNECGRCELCLGRTVEDLPADCGMQYECEGGVTCDAATPCLDGDYCLSGCCVPVLI